MSVPLSALVELCSLPSTELTDDAKAYLKDFGAATASNGAVGLYHIDMLTPEAVEQGESLILPRKEGVKGGVSEC